MDSIITDCISEINNTQIDNAKNIDVVIPTYDLIEYSNYYSGTSWSLRKRYRNNWPLTVTGVLDNFSGDNALFKYKQKITGSI